MHLGSTGLRQDRLDRTSDDALQHIFQMPPGFLPAGRSPVEDEHLVSLPRQKRHQASSGIKVKDVVPVDERVDNQHRRRRSPAAVLNRRVVAQLTLPNQRCDHAGGRRHRRRHGPRGRQLHLAARFLGDGKGMPRLGRTSPGHPVQPPVHMPARQPSPRLAFGLAQPPAVEPPLPLFEKFTQRQQCQEFAAAASGAASETVFGDIARAVRRRVVVVRRAVGLRAAGLVTLAAGSLRTRCAVSSSSCS